jgi:hypothetical protein
MTNEQRRAPARRRMPRVGITLALIGAFAFMLDGAQAEQHNLQYHNAIPLPQYHYGAKIPVACLNRSMCVFILPTRVSLYGPLKSQDETEY